MRQSMYKCVADFKALHKNTPSTQGALIFSSFFQALNAPLFPGPTPAHLGPGRTQLPWPAVPKDCPPHLAHLGQGPEGLATHSRHIVAQIS